MMEAVKGLLRSKKALAMIVGVIATVAGKLGWDIETDQLLLMVSPIIAYILGQSVADHGAQGSNSANAGS